MTFNPMNSMKRENPFDVLEVDPQSTPRDLTKRLKKLADRAQDEDRIVLQSLWEKITLHEADRVRWALLAHPRPDSADGRGIDLLRSALPLPAAPLDRATPPLQTADVICWNTEKRSIAHLSPTFPWR